MARLSTSQLLRLPGVHALVTASQSDFGNGNLASFVSDPANSDAVAHAATRRKKDVYIWYCRAVTALQTLDECLPVGSRTPLPMPSVTWIGTGGNPADDPSRFASTPGVSSLAPTAVALGSNSGLPVSDLPVVPLPAPVLAEAVAPSGPG